MVPHTNNTTPPNNWPDFFQYHRCNMLEDKLDIAKKLQPRLEWSLTDTMTPEGANIISEGEHHDQEELTTEDSPSSEGAQNGDPAHLPTTSATASLSTQNFSKTVLTLNEISSNDATLKRSNISPRIHSGWNEQHQHNTHFKTRIQANTACLNTNNHT